MGGIAKELSKTQRKEACEACVLANEPSDNGAVWGATSQKCFAEYGMAGAFFSRSQSYTHAQHSACMNSASARTIVISAKCLPAIVEGGVAIVHTRTGAGLRAACADFTGSTGSTAYLWRGTHHLSCAHARN